MNIAAIRNLEGDEKGDPIASMTEATHIGDESNGRSSAVSIVHQGTARIFILMDQEPV